MQIKWNILKQMKEKHIETRPEVWGSSFPSRDLPIDLHLDSLEDSIKTTLLLYSLLFPSIHFSFLIFSYHFTSLFFSLHFSSLFFSSYLSITTFFSSLLFSSLLFSSYLSITTFFSSLLICPSLLSSLLSSLPFSSRFSTMLWSHLITTAANTRCPAEHRPLISRGTSPIE